MLKRFICVFLSLALILSSISMSAFAAEPKREQYSNDKEKSAGSSSAKPSDGYTPSRSKREDRVKADGAGNKGAASLKVLLIEDALPWDSDANEEVLDSIGVSYDVVSTSDFVENVDLEQYGVVIFANDQAFEAYENYNEFKEYLELFARVGGVIVFGACDAGWAAGYLSTELPGGVQKSYEDYCYTNYISDNRHPIVTGELSDNQPLLDEDLINNYCSHTSFYEDSLPAGSRVILRNSDNDAPTLVEYPLENGRVIASGLTWEHAYYFVGEEWEDDIHCGDFAVKALDDLFLYAIRVSNIQMNDLHRLREYRLTAKAHYIFVSEHGKNNNMPIKGAKVMVDDTEYLTDENGAVPVTDFGKKTVKISADGYQSVQLTYTLAEKTARIFILTQKDALKLPYITCLQDINNEYDYMSQKVYYPEGSDESVNIKMEADWQGKTAAEYVLFQTNEKGDILTRIVSLTGDFDVKPGTFFKPGYDVNARLYASDGTASKVIRSGIVVTESAANSGADAVEDLTSFRLFEDTDATLNDSNATKILPSTWSLKIDAFPVEVKKSYDPEDGSSTIKGTIGLAGGKWTDNLLDDESGEGEWWTLKSEIEKAKELYTSRKNLFNKYKEKMADSKMTSQVKAKLEAIGYFEVKLNAFGDIVKTSGGLLIKGSGSYTWGQTFTLGPVPVYYEVVFGAKVDASVGLKLQCVDKDWSIGLEGSLSFTIPDITIGGGLGIYGVAQVGVEGNGGLELGIIPTWKGTLKASASFKIKVLFLGEFKWQLGNEWKKQLWPKANGIQANHFNEMYAAAQDNDEVIVSRISDDYSYYTSWWYGEGEILQEWILPDTMPEIIETEDLMMAFFQSNIEGQVKLVYSVYDGYAWSEPEPVCDDSTYDAFYQPIAAENGDIYVVWQKIASEITDDENIENIVEDAIAHCEVYAAKWDAFECVFSEPVRLTNNAVLDMLPRIADNGNVCVAAWVNDPGNNYMGGSTVSYIQYSTVDGDIWTQPQTLVTAAGSISDLAVGFIHGDIVAFYIINDTLYSSIDDQPVSEGQSIDNGLTYYNGIFYWYSDGILYAYTENGVSAVTDESISIGGNYRVVSGEKNAVVWAVNESERGVLYASIYTDGHWSKPIEIYSGEGYSISYFDVKLGMDGAWYMMIDAVSDPYDEDIDEEMTSLLFHRIDDLCDIKLDYAYIIENERNGNIQPIDICVVNCGDTSVTSLHVEIEGDEFELYDEYIENCYIEPGAAAIFTLDLDVSDITGETMLSVWVSTDFEIDYDNNYCEIMIGLVDAAIDLDYYYSEDSVIIAAKVKNNGVLPLHATISVIEDNESGIVMDMKNLGIVTANEDILYLYTFNIGEIEFKNHQSKNYVFRVSTLEEDYNKTNNDEIAIIYNDGSNLEHHPGDTDGNGAVNTTDVILVRRYIAGGYNVTIDENAADVDGNGVINTTDVILMRRFIAGGYGVVLKPGNIA